MAIWETLFLQLQTDASVAGETPEIGQLLEHMFDIILTPRDIGEHLHILDIHANKLFYPAPDAVANMFFLTPPDKDEDGFPMVADLFFKDGCGKIWWFTFSARRRSIAGGWAQFVREKDLAAGDKVSVWRAGVKDAYGVEIFGIECQKGLGKHERGIISVAHQLFDEMPQWGYVARSSLTSLSSISSDLEPTENSLQRHISGREGDWNFGVIEEEEEEVEQSEPWVDDIDSSLPVTLNSTRKPPTPLTLPGFLDRDSALLYCTLFPPDYEFERDTLVQLWMAHGLFVVEPFERVAGLFFECCLADGYFEFCRSNMVTGKAIYKFKGDTHLDALLRSRGRNIVRIEGSSNLNGFSPEVSHVSLRCCNQIDSSALDGFKRFKQLRTLMFLQGHGLNVKRVPHDFFLSLEQLRALDLSQTHLSKLPNSLGNLKCLHYLDVSQTPIKRLPETIDCISSLQTLKLRDCSNLFTLPKGMRKLINLRHLDLDVLRQLRSMPQGMEALTNIRTLPAFLVGVEDECSIRQLKNMNLLSGSFCISRLENVSTGEEAMEACLCRKSHLKKLELRWSNSEDEDIAGDVKILSSLKPNVNLEELQILCYGGSEIPRWICDPAFSELVTVTLFKCENCLVLPSLGQLPSLKVLNIVEFHKLKVIDRNFCGVGIQGYIAFRNLQKLVIESMYNLEEWKEIGESDFPCLRKLMLKHCPHLHSLCTLSTLHALEYLEISHCSMLASCPEGTLPATVQTFIIESCPFISSSLLSDRSQDWLKVAHVPCIWVDHQEISVGQRSQ